MAGDILIIESVATNRIVLKVKLLAAQYRVRPCATIAEAQREIAASLPDLIMLDTCHDKAEAIAFIQSLAASPSTRVVPVIATGGFTTPDDRVAALNAGADDVLNRPFDDQILQARIRSLLRARDARQELQMREGTRTALGFAEAGSTFNTGARITIASGTILAPDCFEGLRAHMENAQINQVSLDRLIAGQGSLQVSDLYVIDLRGGLSDDNTLFRLLSELRSRSHTRHSSLMVLLAETDQKAAAMALDLGANDIVTCRVNSTEIALRAKTLIRDKLDADALRQTVETGLEAAITDQLTGLFNRRYALPHLARMAMESQRNGRHCAIMVLDLDHFKAINDAYGHAMGDDVLRQVAHRLQGNLRAVDMLARIGGEEFLVAIPNSDSVHARAAAERLCSLISDTPFFIGPEKCEVNVTLSVGVSLSSGVENLNMQDNLEGLVNTADLALYDAKNAGRNTVILSAA